MTTTAAGSTATGWTAPLALAPVQADVELPGSKSQTNRALILAALSDTPSRIYGGLHARDSDLMLAALQTLGTGIELLPGEWRITPATFGPGSIDTGLAGTVMRFLPPAAALAHGAVSFDGDLYARERPMRTLLDGLRQAGVSIDDGDRGTLPFTLYGTGTVEGGKVRIDASASSQFVSGLLLCGARYERGIEIEHIGIDEVPSAPHIDMTVQALRAAGVQVSSDGTRNWSVAPGPITANDVTIEADLSNAGPFLAAAVATGGRVTIGNWPAHTTQAGDALRGLLEQFGAEVTREAGALVVRGTGQIHGVDVDLHDVSELCTIVAVLAALADSPSHLRGLAHVRGHETDRLAALHSELHALGGDVSEHSDGLSITPRPLHGGLWRAHADHRMATAGAVLGLVVAGVEIDDIATTSKTMPDFVQLWTGMLGL